MGYSVRFDDSTGPETKLKYMTDGMLLREAIGDSILRRYKITVVWDTLAVFVLYIYIICSKYQKIENSQGMREIPRKENKQKEE